MIVVHVPPKKPLWNPLAKTPSEAEELQHRVEYLRAYALRAERDWQLLDIDLQAQIQAAEQKLRLIEKAEEREQRRANVQSIADPWEKQA